MCANLTTTFEINVVEFKKITTVLLRRRWSSLPAKKFKRVTVTCNQQLKGLKAALEKTKDLEPVNVADHVGGDINRYTMYLLMKSVKETGFPSIAEYDVYYYFLCSKSPHLAVHFFWKVASFTEDVDERNAEILRKTRTHTSTEQVIEY